MAEQAKFHWGRFVYFHGVEGGGSLYTHKTKTSTSPHFKKKNQKNKIISVWHRHADIVLVGRRSGRSVFRHRKIQHKSEEIKAAFPLCGNPLPACQDLESRCLTLEVLPAQQRRTSRQAGQRADAGDVCFHSAVCLRRSADVP